MRSVVKGRNITNTYRVDCHKKEITVNGENKMVYTGKPNVVRESKTTGWSDICVFKGEPHYNEGFIRYFNYATCIGKLNISEAKEISIVEQVFRADLNELHLFSNEILHEEDVNKEESERLCESEIRKFNKQMIESNEKMKSYCEIHKLNLEETDCIELFGIIFPDSEYEIVDGVMKKSSRESYDISGITYKVNNSSTDTCDCLAV